MDDVSAIGDISSCLAPLTTRVFISDVYSYGSNWNTTLVNRITATGLI